MNESVKLFRERVNYRVLLTLIPFVAFGTGFLVLSPYAEEWKWPIRAVVFREVGVFLLVTAALTLLFDIAGKRAFTDEILAKANMSRDLGDAGVDLLTSDFKERIPWADLFKNATCLDLFVSYASTWRNQYLVQIEKLLARKHSRIRVILPDPNDETVLSILAARFQKDKSQLKQSIEESVKFWEDRQKAGAVEIFFTNIIPLFTIYLFNTKGVWAFYNHRLGRLPVPSVVCDENGYLFRYLTNEFEGILGSAKPAKSANIQH